MIRNEKRRRALVKALVRFTSKHDERTAISGVHIDNRGTAIASDGHRLLWVEDFTRNPELMGKTFAVVGNGFDPFIEIEEPFPPWRTMIPSKADATHSFVTTVPLGLRGVGATLPCSLLDNGELVVGSPVARERILCFIDALLLNGLPPDSTLRLWVGGASLPVVIEPIHDKEDQPEWSAMLMPYDGRTTPPFSHLGT